jgi:ubiquinone/menaquinone biosynthesis C-methylase UbiE
LEKVNINLGQDEKVWSKEWGQLTPESEIRMGDFYGLRQWISKYTPRYGKVIEAGCGLGRYVFYFARMGIDIEGVDFSKETIEYLNQWKSKNNFDIEFKTGNITKLDYPDNSLSGYISLGVIEHFVEGPQKALAEAHRILRPGGVAIITTPNVSFSILSRRIKKNFKNTIKKILGKKVIKEPFYQYWYTPAKLKKFVEESGLKVSKCKGADLLFAFFEKADYSDVKIKEGTFGYKFSHKHENSFLSFLGSQSITISIKTADVMHCFLCGDLKAKKSSLSVYDVPICEKCSDKDTSGFYKKNKEAKYSGLYIINAPVLPVTKCKCDFCGEKYLTDELFEAFGFGKNVCSECLKLPDVNILLSNEFVKPVWRKRPINDNL